MRAALLHFLLLTSWWFAISWVVHASSTGQTEHSHDLRGMLFPSPTLHSTSSVKRLHPLLHYSITHEDGTPLLYFHPDTPAELRAKQSRVKKEKVAHFQRVMASSDPAKFVSSESNPYDHSFHRSQESVFPSTPFRTSNSNHIIQPFPDTLLLTIRLPSSTEDDISNSKSPHLQDLHHHSKEFVNLRLNIAKEIYDWESTRMVSIRTGDGEEIVAVPFILSSYKGFFTAGEHGSDGWLTLTLHADGRFQLILHDQGSEGITYQVDLVEHHAPDTEDMAHFERIQHTSFHTVLMRDLNDSKTVFAAGGHGMVVFTHSNYREELTNKYKCGATDQHISLKSNIKKPHGNRRMNSWGLDLNAVSSRHQAESKQTGVRQSPTGRKLQTVAMWPNCFPGQTTPQRFSIGIIADTGYYQSYANDVNQIQAGLAQLFTWSNMIYNAQLNVVLTMTDTIMYATLAQSPNNQPPSGYSGVNFNEVPTCAQTINDKLNGMSAFRAQVEQGHDAIWHLVTNCWQSGTVGLAYIGSLCNGWAVGVSSRITDHYRAFAHEIGHNFGAQHTFGIGGLMDYGDARYPPGTGDFEFAPDNQSQVCGYLTSLFNSKPSGFSPYCYQATTIAPAAVCGNGIVEGNEACDDASSCCDQRTCKLKAGMQCSKESECCTGSTCQFKPSTISCSSGYCANGKCTPSVCTGVSSMPSFCSVPATTPCKQSCKSTATSASCVTTWTTPNINVLDGTICSLAPLSICSSGACVSTVAVTFAWTTGNWGTCSCSGTQTRDVKCQGSDGTIGSVSQCSGTAPAISQACTVPSTCNTYNWQTTPWSGCNSTCQQSRSVSCFSSPTTGSTATSVLVSDSLCPSAKPTASQDCDTATCFFQWTAGSYTGCSQQCSSGIMNREVKCQQNYQGTIVDVSSSFCTSSTMPPTSTACNTSPCANYYLTYGVWGDCQTECVNGTTIGSQTRTATCVSQTAPTTPVTLSNCLCGPGTSNLQCPATAQVCTNSATGTSCGQPPAAKMYDWRIGTWSPCSVSKCGGGTRTRTVACYESGGAIAVDYLCTNAKPTSVDNCNTEVCVSYSWAVGSFGGCSKPCGGGTQTRAVGCIAIADAGQQPAPASSCQTSSMPASSQPCNAQPCSNAPVTYYWYVSDWTSCSRNCGGGIQFRQVWCAQTGSVARVSPTYCAKLTLPSFFQSCNSRACKTASAVEAPNVPSAAPVEVNITYMWIANEWSDCSSICGVGANRVRTIECSDILTGIAVDMSNCNPILRPAETAACTNRDCQTYWFMSEWSQCSAECNGGMETRQVECRLIHTPTDRKLNVTKLDDSMCVGTKPATVSSCNLDLCPTWSMGDWTTCSTSCGDGVQTRTATCVDGRGFTIDDSSCGMIQMPAATQTCAPVPCGYWQQDTSVSWSPCTKKCNGGNSSLPLVCILAEGTTYGTVDTEQNGQLGIGCAQNLIPGSAGVPRTTRICNIDSCPAYYFDIRDYSECSKACGSGVQTGRAVCVQSRDDSIVPNSFCIGSPPIDTTRACNTAACPNYEYMIATDWSACSVQCGKGVQTRTVVCVNNAISPDSPAAKRTQVVDFSNCLASVKMSPPPVDRVCTVPESVCYGLNRLATDSTTDIAANGKCVEGFCLCRSGYTYQNCSGAPFITNVRTSMDPLIQGSQTQPLALKDKIEIRWEFQGQLDTVSVLIMQSNNNVNSISQYIATDIPNTGRFLWHIGANFVPLPLSEDPDAAPPSYRFTVWFSPGTFSTTSNMFTFSDPCAYLNCGLHGTCTIGEPSTPLNRITSAATLILPNRPDSAPAYCQCQQSSGFTGQHCEIGPCTSSKCSTYGVCNDETAFLTLLASNSSTVCNCSNGWSGAQCRTPVPECKPICHNGGDLNDAVMHSTNNGSVRVVDSCGRCQCMNQWSGSDCSQCTLQCLNTGQPTPDCTRCDCDISSGWFGSRCECRYYLLTMHLSIPGMDEPQLTSQWFADDEGAQVRLNILQATLRNDLMVGARQLNRAHQSSDSAGDIMIDVVSFIQVSNGSSNASSGPKNIIEATAKFSLQCPEQSLLITPSGSQSKSRPSRSSSHPDSALLTAYNLYSALLANLDSPVYRGVLTSQLDRTISVHVLDPTKLDSPQNPPPAVDPFFIQKVTPDGPGGGGTDQPTSGTDDSGFAKFAHSTNVSKEGWIGIFVGIAVFIILACILAFAIVKYRKKQDARETEKIRSLEELGIRAMNPNPALQGLGTEQIQLQPMPVSPPDQSINQPPAPNTTPASDISDMAISGPRYNYMYKNPYLESRSTLSIYPRANPSLSISPRSIEEHLAELQEPSVFPNEMTRVKSKSPPVASPSEKI